MQQQLKNLPNDPGIYIFKNDKDKILYIGKAKNLRKRVKSYFRPKHSHPRTRALISNIADLEVILTKTEIEALLLERNLIKKHQPKYNILLRDDKSFPLVRIDLNSKWPRVTKVRRRSDDGALYLGPFVNESQLYRMMKAAYRIFPLIRCSEHEFKNAKRPCNYYHMNMCLGPCTLDVKRQDYIDIIDRTTRFLQGKNKELTKEVEKKMLTASEREDYQAAAALRDQLFALKKSIEPQHVEFHGLPDADAIGTDVDDHSLSINILCVRDEKTST